MEPKSNCENCNRKLMSSKEFQYCEYCTSMWEAGKEEMFEGVKKATELFVYGDNPPHFSITEDNAKEFLKEVANGIKRKN